MLPTWGAKVPLVHSLQIELPLFSLNLPLGHKMHAEALKAPGDEEKLPMSQSTQVVFKSLLNVPEGQISQFVLSILET